MSRVVPEPPLLLHVLRIGHVPVGHACERDPGDLFTADHPHIAGHEVQVRMPDFVLVGDIAMRRTPFPATLDSYRTAHDSLALAP